MIPDPRCQFRERWWLSPLRCNSLCSLCIERWKAQLRMGYCSENPKIWKISTYWKITHQISTVISNLVPEFLVAILYLFIYLFSLWGRDWKFSLRSLTDLRKQVNIPFTSKSFQMKELLQISPWLNIQSARHFHLSMFSV